MNIVIVTFNYRVGPYGFLASQEVEDNGNINVGLLDQRKVFQWVQQYIYKVSLALIGELSFNPKSLEETPITLPLEEILLEVHPSISSSPLTVAAMMACSMQPLQSLSRLGRNLLSHNASISIML